MPKGLELKSRLLFQSPKGKRAVKGTFGVVGNIKKQQTKEQIIEKNRKAMDIILDNLVEDMKIVSSEKKE